MQFPDAPEHRGTGKTKAGEKAQRPALMNSNLNCGNVWFSNLIETEKIAVKVLYRNGVCPNGVITGLDTNKKLLRLSTGNGEKKVKIKAIRSIE